MFSLSTNVIRTTKFITQKYLNFSCDQLCYLYSAITLGMPDYKMGREKVAIQLKGVEDKFRSKMQEFSHPNSNDLVFTEDLKQVLYLMDGRPEDITLVKNMLNKFRKQNEQLRFGNFLFGPVVMRTFYILNKPKELLEIYKDPSLTTYFDQVGSHLILMDLLFKNGMYLEILEVYNIFTEKQMVCGDYPKVIMVLVFAACYKLNTVEHYEYMKKLWLEMKESGTIPVVRTVLYAATLALNHDNPHIALEMLSILPKDDFVEIKSVKIISYLFLNRLDDAIALLQNILEQDSPYTKHKILSIDILNKVQEAVSNDERKDIAVKFDRIKKQLHEQNYVTSDSFDSFLCSEIDLGPHRNNDALKSVFQRKMNKRVNVFRRPGLEEMV